jgi:hypothetical protein
MEQVIKTQDALAELCAAEGEEGEEPGLADLIVFENKRSEQLVETVAEDHAIQVSEGVEGRVTMRDETLPPPSSFSLLLCCVSPLPPSA